MGGIDVISIDDVDSDDWPTGLLCAYELDPLRTDDYRRHRRSVSKRSIETIDHPQRTRQVPRTESNYHRPSMHGGGVLEMERTHSNGLTCRGRMGIIGT